VRPAVFFDRDGTLNEDVGYLDRLDRLRFYPYATDALRVLARAGYALVVVTNQAGIALGIIDEPIVEGIHAHITGRLAQAGVRLDGIYYCPHHPTAKVERYRTECDCRKPKPGMVRRAAHDLQLDLTRSFVVGDRWLDVGVANAVGARGLLVRSGYGATEEAHRPDGVEAVAVVDHAMAAASWILRNGGGGAA
jgi:D-glycero-D-manno-heptose 1,7-bisphosphate phosphatase